MAVQGHCDSHDTTSGFTQALGSLVGGGEDRASAQKGSLGKGLLL